MKTLRLLLTCVAALFVTTTLPAAPGNLDLSFGGTGVVTTPVNTGADAGYAVAVQKDGKIVVAGGASTGFFPAKMGLVRYERDGSLDVSFGSGGKVVLPVVSSSDSFDAVVVQEDGKVVLAGHTQGTNAWDFITVRLNADGSLDTSFGGTGMVQTDVQSTRDVAHSVAVQPDGCVVVVGQSGIRTGDEVFNDLTIVRYLPNGSLDPAFNGTGKVIEDLNRDEPYFRVALEPGGKILVTEGGGTFAVQRYFANGMLDASFGNAGRVGAFGGEYSNSESIALHGGKIVVAGAAYGPMDGAFLSFALARYHENGSLDLSFNGTGKVLTSFGPAPHWVFGMVVQRNGKIVVLGRYGGDIVLVRYNVDGSLDGSFNGPRVVGSISQIYDLGAGLALQGDGKIVVTTGTSSDISSDFFVSRREGDSPVEARILATAGTVAGNLVGAELSDAPGYRLTKLGVPAITNRAIIAMSGAARHGGTGRTLTGVLLGSRAPGAAAHTFRMPLQVGAAVPESAGLGAGLLWKAFPREPFMDYQDDVAATSAVELGFYGRVAGPGVTNANDDVLGYYSLPEVGDEVLVAFAREGGDAPGVPGGKFKSFTSAATAVRTLTFGVLPPARSVMFTAMLQTGPSGTPGPGGVDRSNDMGLWVWENGVLGLALREGQEIDGRTVRSFVALRGPVGHGHGVTEDLESYHMAATQDGFTTTVLITFTDGGRRLAVAGSRGTGKLIDENTDAHWVDAGDRLPWGRIGSFSRNGYGYTVLLTSLFGVPSTVNAAVLFETGDAESFMRVVKGDMLPDGSVLTALATPVGNRGYGLAFAGKTNTGVSGAWWGPAGQNALGMAEFFRATGEAAAAGGGVWRKLYANALPDGMGPLFTAKLRAGSATVPAPGGVTAATDLGLWVVDSFGTTHLLVREGQPLAGKTVKTFKALTAVSGSPAQSRSFNGRRDVIVWVLATDFTQHLVHFAVP
jgi:uncharacterized delta-60 repeat protein